jgi:hypothetical protein
MVGITLSPEQIRSAPPEVRQWLEHEIARSLGLRPASDAVASPTHLAALSPREAVALYGSIRGMVPVVNVFFELGREGTSVGQEGIEAFRLADMLRHTHLPGMEQLAACLQVIDQSFRRIRDDEDAALFILDPRGYCIVAAATQQSVLAVWRQEIAAQQLVADAEAPAVPDTAPAEASAPFSMSGTVPPTSVHLGRPFSMPAGPAAVTSAAAGGR